MRELQTKLVLNDKKLNKMVSLYKPKGKSLRFREIDILRGICIILVLLYHTCVYTSMLPNIFNIYSDPMNVNEGLRSFIYFCSDMSAQEGVMEFLVQLFSSVFIVLTGLSTVFSRDNLKRGVLLLVVAELYTTITYIISTFMGSKSIVVVFGILHLLSFCLLFKCFVDWVYRLIFKKEPPVVFYMILAILIFWIGIVFRYVYFPGFIQAHSDPYFASYPNIESIIKICCGVTAFGSDYFPIFPKASFFFLGVVIGHIFYMNRKKPYFKFLDSKVFLPINFIGSHTIYFYVAFPFVYFIIVGTILLGMGYGLLI